MPLTIPPAVNYQSPVMPLPDMWMGNPPEGAMMVPCEVLWASMGGAGSNKCIAFNLAQNAPQTFSRIAALSVDNSKCGADVQFVFTDTGDVVTIPAYSPKIIVPVFSRDTKFFLLNANPLLSGDVTRFIAHNTMPPPLAVPVTQAQNIIAVGAQDIAAGTTALLAAGNSGTLENGVVTITSQAGGGSFLARFEIQDGTGKKLASFAWSHTNTAGTDWAVTAIAWQISQAHLRFSNGLNLVQTILSGAASANQNFISTNLYYRTP